MWIAFQYDNGRVRAALRCAALRGAAAAFALAHPPPCAPLLTPVLRLQGCELPHFGRIVLQSAPGTGPGDAGAKTPTFVICSRARRAPSRLCPATLVSA